MRRLSIVLGLALVAAACSIGSDDETASHEPAAAIGDVDFAGTIDLDIEAPDRCEVIGEICALPFPSDALTIEDPAAVTGRRV